MILPRIKLFSEFDPEELKKEIPHKSFLSKLGNSVGVGLIGGSMAGGLPGAGIGGLVGGKSGAKIGGAIGTAVVGLPIAAAMWSTMSNKSINEKNERNKRLYRLYTNPKEELLSELEEAKINLAHSKIKLPPEFYKMIDKTFPAFIDVIDKEFKKSNKKNYTLVYRIPTLITHDELERIYNKKGNIIPLFSLRDQSENGENSIVYFPSSSTYGIMPNDDAWEIIDGFYEAEGGTIPEKGEFKTLKEAIIAEFKRNVLPGSFENKWLGIVKQKL